MAGHTLGKYRLLRCIGVGGMAEVYEARRADDPAAGERLAVKVLLPQHVHDIEIIRSFIDEATIAASLSHPNVVGVLDYGCADDQYFIAMEHVDGWDLHDLIELSSMVHHPMPVGAAAYVIHELARALDYIHTRPFEIVHRDVTPHNVFVDRSGRIKLSDFGVAKTAVRWSQTHTGLIKGKLGYLAPEQVRGEPVSSRTDIYSSGLILYELLSCQRYNRSSTQSGLLTRAHDPVVVLPSAANVDAAPLDEVVRGALQHDPAMRTRDAALLAEQTRRVLERHPFAAGDMARLAEGLQGEVRAEQTIPDRRPDLRRVLRPMPIEGVASGELVLEETLRTAPRSFGEGLGPEALLDAPDTGELMLEETVRTGAPDTVDPPSPAGGLRGLVAAHTPDVAGPPDRPVAVLAPEPALKPTKTEESYISGATTMPGGQESGLIRLLRAPSDRPLQPSPTAVENLPPPPPARRVRWGWLVASAVVFAVAGVLFLVRWSAMTSQTTRSDRRTTPAATGGTAARRDAGAATSRPAAGSRPSADAAAEPSGEQALERVLASAEQRGLWPGDLPELDRLHGEARWALRNQKSSRWEIQRLARFVHRFRISPPFVRGKLDSLKELITRRGKGEQERRRDALRQIELQIEQGQLVAASRSITVITQELRRP